MLYGELISETNDSITFRVIGNAGDAITFGIWGEHTIAKNVGRLTRRETCPGRRYDKLWLPVSELKRLGKASIPIDCDLPEVAGR